MQALDYLRDLTKVLGVGLAVAATPLLVSLSQLEPPWPTGIGKASAVFIVTSALLSWNFIPASHSSVRKRWIVVSTSLAVTAFACYLVLASLFIETSTDGQLRAVRGYACTSQALEVYGQDCTNVGREALDGAEWDETKLWTRESVSVVRIGLAGIWLIFVAALIATVGAVVAGTAKIDTPNAEKTGPSQS